MTTSDGRLLTEHRVRLNPSCWQYEAVTDLVGYLRWRVAPDRRRADEASIVAAVGEWLGEQVLGPVGPALLKERPASVRLIVPREARPLMFWPFQLAYVNGAPIAAQQLGLVVQAAGPALAGPAEVGERLRVLGLFSLPTGSGALNLRRERHALVRVFTKIAADRGRAVDVRVLQYGVTRKRLSDILAEPEGWDLIHISGHGTPGELLLETETGGGDPIDAGDLAALLRPARSRLKLVTVSACWSAAVSELKHVLDLPGVDDPDPATAQEPAAAVATELVDHLGCAVVAMRYPITDDFAIHLAEQLYGRLAGDAQSLPDALAASLTELIPAQSTATRPALSIATPALFGAGAVNLRVAAPPRAAPPRAASLCAEPTGPALAGFPAQPDRFVGRVAVMARASAALAPRSGSRGVLFHGMPGGGKSACAVELAYTHEHAFEQLVWFKAPDEGHDITDALTRFALTLETIVPGVQLVHLVNDAEQFEAGLLNLTGVCERRRLLIAIDNIESLLAESGGWHDDRWGRLIDGLCDHDGPSRLVLTSRRLPAHLPARVRVEAVDALNLDEALLLARELSHLGALIDSTLPGIDPKTARRLAVAVLENAQGHPKLLELANGQAADTAGLVRTLKAADRAWADKGGLPAAFFTAGTSSATGTDYLDVLRAWADSVADQLTDVQRLVFWWLCCMEEDDRNGLVLEHTWTDEWEYRERSGDPPDVHAAVAALADHGLITILPATRKSETAYAIHPAIAEVGRAHAGEDFQQQITVILALYWTGLVKSAEEREETQATGWLVVRAGLASVPYLMRVEQWELAAKSIQWVLIRDDSPTTVASVLPALRRITAATAGTDFEFTAMGVLARALEVVEPAGAESLTRAVLAADLDRGDYWSASVSITGLIRSCLRSGRVGEALRLADEKIAHSRRVLGPWSQLLDQAVRLQVLAHMGRHEEVLAEVIRLREHMSALPETSEEPEAAVPWNVREVLLSTGAGAARELGRLDDAMELSDSVIASKLGRGATEADMAADRANSVTALIGLGRLDEAEEILRECRAIFEDTHDIAALAKVIDDLATVEDRRGHGATAVRLQKDALRYRYLMGDVDSIAVGHHNLGHALALHAADGDGAVTHHLVAALLSTLAGVDVPVQAVVGDLVIFGERCVASLDVAQLCRRAEAVPGVHTGRLLDRLVRDRREAQRELDGLIARARAQARERPSPAASNLATWDPMIAALLAANDGDADAEAAFHRNLALLEESDAYPHFAALIEAMRRICTGHRDSTVLTELNVAEKEVAERALAAVAGRVTIPIELWPAIPVRWLFGDLVAGAHGDPEAAARARRDLNALTDDPDWSALAQALLEVADGSRDPGLVNGLADTTDRAAITTVLRHITT